MRPVRWVILLSFGVAILNGCGKAQEVPREITETREEIPEEQEIRQPRKTTALKRVDCSTLDPSFRFSVEIPRAWEVEFVPEITAINIYDPADPATETREKSQIFIRQFEADRFLTLKTVDILQREEVTVQGHAAVHYGIEKRADVPDFPHQPSWRNARHRLTDVRFTEASPSLFYVFSYRPELPQETFDAFLASLRFHNDEESFVAPLSRLQERSILKPFGIFITAETSPVRPERFSGYHTGTDFEVFEEERTQPVSVLALCGGKLRSKKQAEGYGGVAVQECLLGNEPITVIYGHLALSRVEVNIGAYLAPGDVVGKLGEQGPDTDGERKHLHLGIHHGQDVLLAGYVDHEEALKDWMDPLPLLKEE